MTITLLYFEFKEYIIRYYSGYKLSLCGELHGINQNWDTLAVGPLLYYKEFTLRLDIGDDYE